MSRSIHTTRREFARLVRAGAPEERLQKAFEALRTKHHAKRAVRRERRRAPDVLPLPRPEALPVLVMDEGPHVLHAASPDDVRAVLARLPAGTTDGLAAVRLSLGRWDQLRRARRDGRRAEPDPWTGRLGVEMADGIWCGLVRGAYRPRRALIDVYAHVVAEGEIADWPFWRWMLRFEALRTLVHEAAHHHDCVCRVARGRWRAAPGEGAEAYARARAAEWTRGVVTPYLAERYPEGRALLLDFAAREKARGAARHREDG